MKYGLKFVNKTTSETWAIASLSHVFSQTIWFLQFLIRMDMDVVSTKTYEVVMTEAIARKPKRRRPTKRRKSKKVIKAEKRMREKLKAKKLKLKLSKVLKVYEIPSSILEKYKLEVQVPDNVQAEMVRRRCHQQNYEEFQSSEVPCNLANFMTAFKHATEDRNFEVLYELMSKALEIRNGFLLQQIYEVRRTKVSWVPI